jgi:hypothetical protein
LACHLQIDASPDPAYHFDADPDPAYLFNVDPDPAYLFDADPDAQRCLCISITHYFKRMARCYWSEESYLYFIGHHITKTDTIPLVRL